MEAMTQTARRRVLQLESRLAHGEQERERLQATADTLRQQIRESDEALGEAVRSNEALREQMELQRLDSHDANERDLKLCREMFEKRLEASSQAQNAEQTDLAKQVHRLEEGVGLKEGEREQARDLVTNVTKRRDTLQRDCLLWKAQHELALKMKQDVENDLGTFRQDGIGGELRVLKETYDALTARRADLDSSRAAVIREADEAQRTLKERDNSNAQRARAIRDVQQETEGELQRVHANLSEEESGLAAAKADAAAVLHQMGVRRDALEQEVARVTLELEVEKRDLERKIQAERQSVEQVRRDFEKHRNDHRNSFRDALDTPGQQLSSLESHIAEIRRSSEGEVNALRQKADTSRQRVEELEAELVQMKTKLLQTDREVQESTTRVSQAKEPRGSARDCMEMEKAKKAEELERLQRRIAQRSEQLKAGIRETEEKRKRMLREAEEAKAMMARQVSEADQRMQALKGEYQTALEDKASMHKAGVQNSREKLDALVRENEQLRKHVSEQRHAAKNIHDVGGQMQRTLASMEDRAADLRRDIQRS